MKRLFLFPALLLCALARAQVHYHVTQLGVLAGGLNSFALSINSTGIMSGASTDDRYVYVDACILTPLGIQNIGMLGGMEAWGVSINSSEQVAGYSDIPTAPSGFENAFLYSGGHMQNIGTLGGSYSSAYCINDLGQIVGSADTTGNASTHAFIYQNGVMSDLGTLGGQNSVAEAINTSGQVVGYSNYNGTFNDYHAFTYSNGVMQDIGVPAGFFYSYATSINDSGQIVGYCAPYSGSAAPDTAFLYSNGVMQSLGTLPSYPICAANCINNAGQIVGQCSDDDNDYAGWIYSGGAMTNLNTLLDSSGAGVNFQAASSINDSGLIAGYGTTPSSNGYQQALLLTPVASNVTLPSSFSMFRGVQKSGSLYSIQFNDSWYLTAQPGPTLNPSEAPIQVQLSGTSPTATPANLQFTFTGHANTVGLSESILLYNFTTNAYETLGSASAHNGSDSTVTVTATGNLSRFVNSSTLEVRARVAFAQSGPTALYPWTASLGVANWIIQ